MQTVRELVLRRKSFSLQTRATSYHFSLNSSQLQHLVQDLQKTTRKGDIVMTLCDSVQNAVSGLLACVMTGRIFAPVSIAMTESEMDKTAGVLKPAKIIGRYPTWNAASRPSDEAETAAVPADPVLPDDPAFVFTTSGSTGTPKAVVLTNRNIMTNVASIQETLQLTEKDHVLMVKPFTYASTVVGEFLVGLAAGAKMSFFR